MKRLLTLTLLTALTGAQPAPAQEAPRVELINVPHYVSAAGKARPLDREKPASRSPA